MVNVEVRKNEEGYELNLNTLIYSELLMSNVSFWLRTNFAVFCRETNSFTCKNCPYLASKPKVSYRKLRL